MRASILVYFLAFLAFASALPKRQFDAVGTLTGRIDITLTDLEQRATPEANDTKLTVSDQRLVANATETAGPVLAGHIYTRSILTDEQAAELNVSNSAKGKGYDEGETKEAEQKIAADENKENETAEKEDGKDKKPDQNIFYHRIYATRFMFDPAAKGEYLKGRLFFAYVNSLEETVPENCTEKPYDCSEAEFEFVRSDTGAYVFYTTIDGHETTLAVLSPSHFVGSVGPRHASARRFGPAQLPPLWQRLTPMIAVFLSMFMSRNMQQRNMQYMNQAATSIDEQTAQATQALHEAEEARRRREEGSPDSAHEQEGGAAAPEAAAE